MMDQRTRSQTPLWRTRGGAALLVFLAVSGFLLVYEHRAHIPDSYWLLGALVAICVLMHGFMHGGKHGDGDQERPDEGEK